MRGLGLMLAVDLRTRVAPFLETPMMNHGVIALPAGVPVRLAGTPTTIDLRIRGYEAPWRGDRNNALVRAFLAAIRTVDAAAQPGFVLKTGTSDMNVVAPIWKCPVVAYGPGDSTLDHTPHEHLPLDEYWRAVQVVEAMLRAFAAR